MGSIGTAEACECSFPIFLVIISVHCPLSTILYCCQIPFWQHDIAVKDDEPLALGTFCTVVTALTRAAVRFHEILNIKFVGILVNNSFAVTLRTVFNN